MPTPTIKVAKIDHEFIKSSCLGAILLWRKNLKDSRKQPGYQPGLGSYALFTMTEGAVDFIVDSPTTADFSNENTAARRKQLLADGAGLVVAFRENGKGATVEIWGK
jgi:hypothetical protein